MKQNIEAFRAVIQAYGLQPPDTIQPGKLHRFPGQDKKPGNKAGWCLLFDDLRGGEFGDFSTSIKEHWQAETDRTYTVEERAAFKQRIDAERQQWQAEELRKHKAAAKQADNIMAAANADPSQHPYAIKKAVHFGSLVKRGTWPQRGWTDALLIPIYGANGKIWTLEAINTDGEKDFLKGGRKRGGFHPFGKISGANRVLIGEGLATVAAVHAVDGAPAVAAMDAGNLSAVAQAVRKLTPDAEIVLLADNDIKPDGSNPGLKAATEAAQAVGGRAAVPELDGKKCDFWDLWHERGADAVLDALAKTGDVAAIDPDSDPAKEPFDYNGKTDDEIIAHLSALSLLDYDRQRKIAADSLGVRPAILDKLVSGQRNNGNDGGVDLPNIEPWDDPVEPGRLLDELVTVIKRFIVCEQETATAAALWVAMTWFIDTVQVAPLAVITAPEKRCGKSQLLFLLGKLVNKPLAASNISPAALYRVIDAWKPTLLLDEADAFMKDNEELRGLINCGHTRDSAYVVRVVGENHTPTKFNAWGAKAIAGIGHLAETLMDRAIVLELRRKLSHEQVDRLRHAEPELFDHLAAKLARFAMDYSADVRAARPYLPPQLNDRAQDNWEPLLAIADIASGEWPAMARKAALRLSGGDGESLSIGVELLQDIKEIFDDKNVQRVFTADLLEALLSDDEKPWATYNRGKPITPRQVSHRLSGYGVKSREIRIGYVHKKGYIRDDFEESFTRYLNFPTPPDLSATTRQATDNAGSSVTDENSNTRHATNQDEPAENVPDNANCRATQNNDATPQATAGAGCRVVADKTPIPAETEFF